MDYAAIPIFLRLKTTIEDSLSLLSSSSFLLPNLGEEESSSCQSSNKVFFIIYLGVVATFPLFQTQLQFWVCRINKIKWICLLCTCFFFFLKFDSIKFSSDSILTPYHINSALYLSRACMLFCIPLHYFFLLYWYLSSVLHNEEFKEITPFLRS